MEVEKEGRERGKLLLDLPKPTGMKLLDFSEIKNPHFTSLHEMTFDDFIETYELFYDPKFCIKAETKSSSFAAVIADNFYTGSTSFLSSKLAQERISRGIRYPYYNRRILSKMQYDLRIVQYLGVDGCLALYCLISDRIIRGMSRHANDKDRMTCLKSAASGLQDFFKIFLHEPSIFGSPCNFQQLQREKEKLIFMKISTVMFFERTEKMGALQVFPVLLDRFQAIMDDQYYYNIFQGIRRSALELSYASLRSKTLYLFKKANFFENKLRSRFDILNDSLLPPDYDPSIKKSLERALVNVYLCLDPILRALTLLDTAEQVKDYLEAFQLACLPTKPNLQLTDLSIHVIDNMLADSNFISSSQSKPELAKVVIEMIPKILGFSIKEFAEMAIKKNLLNVTEAMLMAMEPIDKETATELVLLAVKRLKRTSFVEIVFLVIGHCQSLEAEDLLMLCETIETHQILTPKFWKTPIMIIEYNVSVLGRTLLKQAASILKTLAILKKICPQSIPLPCPLEVSDQLYPKLYEYDPTRLPKQEYQLYPHLSLFNLAQLILFRSAQIGFASSRIKSDSSDVPEWREVIGFLNLMVEREAGFRGSNDQLPNFFVPAIEKYIELAAEEKEVTEIVEKETENEDLFVIKYF